MNKLLNMTTFLIVLLIISHLFILQISQFTAWPEMLSYPYLLINGFVNYKDIINPYPPVLPELLSIFYKYVGVGIIQLKVFTYAVIIACDLLVFFIGKKYFSYKAGLYVLIIYMLLQVALEGNGLWFDLFITPLYLILLIFTFEIVNRKKTSRFIYAIYGLFFSISILTKQTSAVLLIILLIYLFLNNFFNNKYKQLVYFTVLFVFCFILTFAYSYYSGSIKDYFFWVFKYPYVHLQSQGFSIFPTLRQLVVFFVFIFLAFIQFFINRRDRKIQIIFIFFLSSLFYAIPRFAFFHLQPAVAFFALLFLAKISKRNFVGRLTVSFGLLFAVCTFFLYYPKYLHKEVRFYDKKTIESAAVLGSQLRDKGPVYFYNISSEYFVIGDILPIKPWADTFPWYLQSTSLQERILKSLKSDDVRFIVMRKFKNEGEFVPGSYIPRSIDIYINENFKAVGAINNEIWILEKNYED